MINIVKQIVPLSKYSIKCPYSMTPVGITVHNTANDASARNEIANMTNNNSEISFHFAVDDKEAVQGIELNRNAWHASDGRFGTGNRKTIAIEICYSKSGGNRFIKAEQNAVELIVYLMKQYGWGIDRVKRHYDYAPNKKYCPHRTMNMGWDRFLNMIKAKLSNSSSTITEPDYTGVITYQAYTNKWLPAVRKCDNTPNGFAGIGNEPITAFRCKPAYGEIIYEAHKLGGGWYGAVNSRDYSSNSINSYAGIPSQAIDLIRIKSTRGYVDYRVKTREDGWLPWVRGFGDRYYEYAGIVGHAIIGIQMK